MKIGIIEKIYLISFLVDKFPSSNIIKNSFMDSHHFKKRSTKDKNEIESIIRTVIAEQKKINEPVRGFTVKENKKVDIDGKIFRTRPKKLVKYCINLTDSKYEDLTKNYPIKLKEIKDIVEKYNIDYNRLRAKIYPLDHISQDPEDLYLTSIPKNPLENGVSDNYVSLRKYYIKLLEEMNFCYYENDVLDENLNLLLKVNNENQR